MKSASRTLSRTIRVLSQDLTEFSQRLVGRIDHFDQQTVSAIKHIKNEQEHMVNVQYAIRDEIGVLRDLVASLKKDIENILFMNNLMKKYVETPPPKVKHRMKRKDL